MTHGPQYIQQEGRQRQNSKEARSGPPQPGESQGSTVAEEWRAVVGYEGFYEVSDMGRVRSLPRWCVSGNGARRFVAGSILSASPTGKTASRGAGYLAVRISVGGDGKLLKVHRAVAEAFLPNPCGHPMVNHDDTNTFNNKASNLEWTDNAGNSEHAARNGLLNPPRGEACVTHKLSGGEVLEIRASDLSARTLASQYGISKTQIKRIKRNESWTHI